MSGGSSPETEALRAGSGSSAQPIRRVEDLDGLPPERIAAPAEDDGVHLVRQPAGEEDLAAALVEKPADEGLEVHLTSSRYRFLATACRCGRKDVVAMRRLWYRSWPRG